MDTEETKTEQEQTESPTFAQRIESITNEWKESILQDTIRIIENGRMTEEDVENIVETVIDNSSDLDYRIEEYIDGYDMDNKIETWVDYNLDVEDKVDDALRYYDWDNVMDEIDIGRFLRRMQGGIAEQITNIIDSEDFKPIEGYATTIGIMTKRIDNIEGRIEAILDMLQNLSTTVFHQVNDIHSKGDA